MGKSSLPPILIRYKGVFDFQGLYQLISDWLATYEYVTAEEKYLHKPGITAGIDQDIIFKSEKKVTSYIKYDIKITLRLYEMSQSEVMKEGNKVLLTNARLDLVLEGDISTDWQEMFKGKPTEKLGKIKTFAGKLLENVILRREMGGYADVLAYHLWNLQALIKKYLSLQSAWHEYAGYLGGG